MLGRNKGISGLASNALDSVSPFTDRLAHDEKLRERLVAALSAGVAARGRAQRQTGAVGVARRLATDSILHAQIKEAAHQLQRAQGRVRKSQSHKLRNTMLFVTGLGMVLAAVPSLRAFALDKVRGTDDWAPDNTAAPFETPDVTGSLGGPDDGLEPPAA